MSDISDADSESPRSSSLKSSIAFLLAAVRLNCWKSSTSSGNRTPFRSKGASLCEVSTCVPKRTPCLCLRVRQPHQVARLQAPVRGGQHARACDVIRRNCDQAQPCEQIADQRVRQNREVPYHERNSSPPQRSTSWARCCACDKALQNFATALRPRAAARFLQRPIALLRRTCRIRATRIFSPSGFSVTSFFAGSNGDFSLMRDHLARRREGFAAWSDNFAIAIRGNLSPAASRCSSSTPQNRSRKIVKLPNDAPRKR